MTIGNHPPFSGHPRSSGAPRWRKLRVLLGIGAGADALPLEVVAAQIRAARERYRSTFVATMLVCASLAWTHRNATHTLSITVGIGLLVAVSIVSLCLWRRDKRRDWVIDDGPKRIVENALLSAATAAAWNVLLMAALNGADEPTAIAVACLILGVISVGALAAATVPLASVSFIACAFAVMVIATPMIQTDMPTGIVALLAMYLMLLTRSILAQSQIFVANFDAGIRLAEAGREKAALAVTAERERARAELVEARAGTDARERAAELRYTDMIRLAEQFEATVVKTARGFETAAERGGTSAHAIARISTDSAKQIDLATARAMESNAAATQMREKANGLVQSVDIVTARIAAQHTLSSHAAASTEQSEKAIERLVQHTDGIDSILQLIGQLTAQTNLLALNATIEAARAGVAGQGFAVVANEVKSLATQSQRAAEGIGRQVSNMRGFVGAVATINARIAEDIRGVSSIGLQIDTAMAEQHRITESIDSHAAVAEVGTTELRAGIETAAQASASSAVLAHDMVTDAAALLVRSQAMASATQAFLKELRAA